MKHPTKPQFNPGKHLLCFLDSKFFADQGKKELLKEENFFKDNLKVNFIVGPVFLF
jgi:hypothetical protein